IVRDKIDLDQQAAKLEIEEVDSEGKKLKLGVLELPSFYGDRDSNERLSSRDVRKLLEQAREAEIDGLLFDLSRNGGGLLEDAVAISGFFVREGGIVAVKDGGKRSRVMPDPDSKLLYAGPMVVLVSRVSASASEIVAGALRDYQRAVIVGDRRTFGKGTVQSVFPLQPGLGALRITTALFFRPGGISTQKSGVASHFVIPSRFDVDSIGESKQRYVLPEQRIPEFRSERANAKKEEDRFVAITPGIVKALAARSSERVSKDKELQEIVEDLAERNQDDGVVVLSELMEEDRNGADPDAPLGAESAPPEEAEETRPPQTEEALRVLADLVMLTR
ncbi:MAG: tail-specific protease, partial [Myxococcales bacterium]|nr:tail-specific protease [Myxococcales bacterium]